MDDRAVAAIGQSLREYGLELHSRYTSTPLADLEPGVPERATVSSGRAAAEFTLLYSPTMTITEVTRMGIEHMGDGILVLGDRVSERSADMFRRRAVNFLDEAGNAFVSFDGVRVDVRGRRAQGTRTESLSVSKSATNLFSTKRSQVICVLLAWPELLDAPLRYAAMTSGVSLGQVQKTLAELQSAGFLAEDDGRRRLRHSRELLDQWAAAFPRGLGSPQRTRTFAGDIGTFETPPGVTAALSGESALAGRIRPETLTIYVDGISVRSLVAKNRWRTDRRPNIFVRTQFWQEPDGPTEGIVTAPAPLVYADLLASGDGRQIEMAEALRESDARLH